MKVYKVIYDGKIKKYDKDGIEDLAFYDLKTIERMVKENKNKFKPDFPEVLNWLEKEIRL